MTNLDVQRRDLEKILANRPAKCSPAREAEYKRFQEILDAINKHQGNFPIDASGTDWDTPPDTDDWG